MRSALRRIWARLGCRLLGCEPKWPVEGGPGNACRYCGALLITRQFIHREVDKMLDEAWARIRRGRGVRRG